MTALGGRPSRRAAILLCMYLAATQAAAQAADVPTMERVGHCPTGFGVPGSGRPFVFGHTVLVNAGEGCPTVLDVADRHRPKILRHISTWYFTSILYPLPSRDVVYLSNSRGPLLALRELKSIASQGDVKPIPWQRGWGRSFLAGLRPDGIGYSVAGDDIVVLDLNHPDQPRELARIPQTTLKSRSLPTFAEDHALGKTLVRESYLLTFPPDFRLAAVLLDRGSRVALLRWRSPTTPRLVGQFPNALVSDRRGAACGRVLAMDGQRLVLGIPASTSKYWRCRKLALWDIRDPAHPRRAAELTFPDPGTHVRDIALAGRYAFVLDGRNIASGHCVRRTQRSRLLVVDLGDLAHPKVAATFVDPMPTEYSQLTLAGHTLYVNDYDFGLWLFDVSDPLKPAKLGGAPVSAEGHWLYLHGDHAYMAHTFGGTIHIIHVADPARPRRVGTYWDGQWLNYKAKIRGTAHAMYLPQLDGLAILDIADPARPRRVGEFLDRDGQPFWEPCLDLAGGRAFVAAAPRRKTPPRLLVYDIAQPLRPRLLSTTTLPGDRGYRLLAAGTMLYLTRYTGERLLAIDVADPLSPRITADLQGAQCRIGEATCSLQIRDGGGNGAPGLAHSRGHLYVATGKPAPKEPYVLIFDVRHKAAIRPAAALHVRNRKGWQYFVCDVVVDGNRLVLGDYGCDEVYDLADPLAPRRIAHHRRSYAWQVGTARGGLLYIPKLDGLDILALPTP